MPEAVPRRAQLLSKATDGAVPAALFRAQVRLGNRLRQRRATTPTRIDLRLASAPSRGLRLGPIRSAAVRRAQSELRGSGVYNTACHCVSTLSASLEITLQSQYSVRPPRDRPHNEAPPCGNPTGIMDTSRVLQQVRTTNQARYTSLFLCRPILCTFLRNDDSCILPGHTLGESDGDSAAGTCTWNLLLSVGHAGPQAMALQRLQLPGHRKARLIPISPNHSISKWISYVCHGVRADVPAATQDKSTFVRCVQPCTVLTTNSNSRAIEARAPSDPHQKQRRGRKIVITTSHHHTYHLTIKRHRPGHHSQTQTHNNAHGNGNIAEPQSHPHSRSRPGSKRYSSRSTRPR